VKRYAILMCIGAAIGITLAEMWRRMVYHDSYANYLPPAPPLESTPIATEPPPEGRVRRGAMRLVSPLAASARADLARVRRVRVGAPAPRAALRDGPDAEGMPPAATT
jgi:hypothetical protein